MARAIDADALKKELAPYEENDFSQQIDVILKIVDAQPTLTPPNEPRIINADKLAKRIAGHSNYHGDSILSAIYCAAEGKENNAPIRPIENQPNEWVSVDERLPGVSGNYICAVKDKNGSVWTIPAEWSLEMKMWIGAFGEIKNIVTHWMPLPKSPKEDE